MPAETTNSPDNLWNRRIYVLTDTDKILVVSNPSSDMIWVKFFRGKGFRQIRDLVLWEHIASGRWEVLEGEWEARMWEIAFRAQEKYNRIL